MLLDTHSQGIYYNHAHIAQQSFFVTVMKGTLLLLLPNPHFVLTKLIESISVEMLLDDTEVKRCCLCLVMVTQLRKRVCPSFKMCH